MIQVRNKITSFIIVSVSFLAISPCQTRWHESNLKGLDQLKVEIIVDGLENAISPTWVESYVVAKLDQYKIWIKEDQPYPLLRVFIVGRPMEEVPGFYYTVEVSLFNYILTMDNYIENFNDNELTKDYVKMVKEKKITQEKLFEMIERYNNIVKQIFIQLKVIK